MSWTFGKYKIQLKGRQNHGDSVGDILIMLIWHVSIFAVPRDYWIRELGGWETVGDF